MPDTGASAGREAAPAARGGGGPATVFLSAGEASGDWTGAMLARTLGELRPDLSLRGIGGRRMAEAGVELTSDSSSWGAIGVFEALSKLPRVLGILRATRHCLGAAPPHVLALIDCGAFNIPLARFARSRGIPTLYYFPPGSWSRRLRGPELRDLVDVIATPFPWSRDLLSGGRALVEWVGHPVVEASQPRITPEKAFTRYGLDPGRRVVALAPGSRDQELGYVFPLLLQAAALISERVGGVQFLVPVAPTLDPARVRAGLERAGVAFTLLQGIDYDALQLAQAAAVCSGTATLEFTCLGVPMVVVYRASRLTTLQYRLMRGVIGRQRWAAMPNIIAGRGIVRELLGSAATPQAVAAEVIDLLSDPARRAQVKEGLAEVKTALGEPGATRRTAELVLGLLGSEEGA
jgi:lipid-A-disaccharide synthase